jgi:hypothetical protein
MNEELQDSANDGAPLTVLTDCAKSIVHIVDAQQTRLGLPCFLV